MRVETPPDDCPLVEMDLQFQDLLRPCDLLLRKTDDEWLLILGDGQVGLARWFVRLESAHQNVPREFRREFPDVSTAALGTWTITAGAEEEVIKEIINVLTSRDPNDETTAPLHSDEFLEYSGSVA